ncbi:sensor histidine kinase [Arthrobacter woluwensis]|uniref:histidine kinase n=1 Tax=Arthrobacter woluwensis TaxID=156980 RepID=A0A1H4KWE1_9MICC|nr:HAMP domain-containing sensor histidine kinase [Arthrobacter woluwensis]SEB62408.1 two-component system, OmpR family, sensor histidine kinase VanS [Arthrobacter woluwensis]
MSGLPPASVTTAPSQPRPRGLGLRLKLTLSYAAFLFVSGSGFFALVLLLLRYLPAGFLVTVDGGFAPSRRDLMEALLPKAALGLLFFAVVGLVGGWLLAGAMLRPIGRIHEVALAVQRGEVDRRIRLEGKGDELRELADSVDAMLDRLSAMLEEQRRFAANASHELRTPHAVMGGMLELAASDPDAVDVPHLLRRLREVNTRATGTVEALLALTRAEGSRLLPEPCDLAELAEEALGSQREELESRRITVLADYGGAPVEGDRVLLAQLVGNLVRNAVVHNLAEGGDLWLRTGEEPGGEAFLEIQNPGETVSQELLGRLTEPFVQGRGRQAGPGRGSGLGLAIVAAIAQAHGARLDLTARPEGGLRVRVTFPQAE